MQSYGSALILLFSVFGKSEVVALDNVWYLAVLNKLSDDELYTDFSVELGTAKGPHLWTVFTPIPSV